jgi:DNA-damage-inducible protein J
MAQSTNVNIRMDKELKKQAEKLFEEFGMNMSTAVNVFIKAAVRERKIPFQIALPPDDFYNTHNQIRLNESIKQLTNGQSQTRSLVEVADE